MGRKVFISVLGTGFYEPTSYVCPGYKSQELRFIQEACLKQIGVSSWQASDVVLMLLTKAARTKNWNADIVNRAKYPGSEPLEYEGLEKRLKCMQLPCAVKDVSIANGSNEAEMWHIFDKLYRLIEAGDEVYFDLTHSFRYLPMLVLVFGNYIKFLKKVTIKGVSYGNWESRDIASNEAPIIDLLPLVALQEWTFAAANYLENGKVDQLVGLSKMELAPVLRATKGADKALTTLNSFIKELEIVVNERIYCRGRELVGSRSVARLKQCSAALSETFIKPLNPVFDKIKSSLDRFTGHDSVANGFEAAQWCKENGLYQQALTIGYEMLFTAICVQNGLDWTEQGNRDLVSKVFNIVRKEQKQKKGNEFTKEMWNLSDLKQYTHDEAVEWICRIKRCPLVAVCIEPYHLMIDLRNDYNHGGFKGNAASISRMRNLLDKIFRSLANIMAVWKNEFESPCVTDRLMINLSNHPCELWSEVQKEASKVYGEVMDMPFPAIEPSLSEVEVMAIANEYIIEIERLRTKHYITVHIMGEMVFTNYVSRMLLERGIACVASTTERITLQRSESIKESEFRFIRFRQYI